MVDGFTSIADAFVLKGIVEVESDGDHPWVGHELHRSAILVRCWTLSIEFLASGFDIQHNVVA